MKSLARTHVWWPQLDKDVASLVRSCSSCQAVRNRPSAAPSMGVAREPSAKIATKQAIAKESHDSRSKNREFEVKETVLVENFRGEPKWITVTVVERTGPVSYRYLEKARRSDTGL